MAAAGARQTLNLNTKRALGPRVEPEAESSRSTSESRSTFPSSISPTSTSPSTSAPSLPQPLPAPPSPNPTDNTTATTPFNPSTTLAFTTVTSSVPVTVTSPSTTFLSFTPTTFTSSVVVTTSLPNSGAIAGVNDPVCIGHGIDISVVGLLSVLILPSVVGILIWLIFALIRPHFRHVYGVREWFPPPDARPQPLRDTFWAFLFPHVPFIPSVPSRSEIVNSQGGSDLPSDGQLSQRVLWSCFLIVLGWSFLALLGALPLYLINTPCLAQSVPRSQFGGIYSTLQDLSLLRLLQLLEDVNFSTRSAVVVQARAVVDGTDVSDKIRTRLIILTVFVIVLAMLPALYKILKEFSTLVEYRKNWTAVRCNGLELGWLSAEKAPGFKGWGEKRIKDFIIKVGLSGSLDRNIGIAPSGGLAGIGSGYKGRSQRRTTVRDESERPLNDDEKAQLEVDISALFTIGDTGHLTALIHERDRILDHLEVAEARYIFSFKLSTPEPSVAELHIPPEDENDLKRHISRPRALSASATPRYRTPRKRRHAGSTSAAPTSYVAPSQYYKLRGVRGIGSGLINTDSSGAEDAPSFGETVRSRVVGTRFQEVNRDSLAYDGLPLGSRVAVNRAGTLGPMSQSIDVPLGFGPNHGHDPSSGNEGDKESSPYGGAGSIDPATLTSKGRSDSEDVPVSLSGQGSSRLYDSPALFGEYAWTPTPRAEPSGDEPIGFARVRPDPQPPLERRETFAMRNEQQEVQVPPHLRLQPQQPFVRPLSGLDHDDLGAVYSDIREWRTRLKQINGEIADAQNDCYNDIADGVRTRGWLLVGKGIRHLPGIELIEGRSKEDVLWDELQQGGGITNKVLFWAFVAMVAILLGAALIAICGLVVATAPGVAHLLHLFEPLQDSGDKLGPGIVTTLVPAVAASLFLAFAIAGVRYASRRGGAISVSATRLMAYKAAFYILVILGALWLTAAGALIFSLQAFDISSGRTHSVANGSIYMSAFFLCLVINVAIISPGLLLLQPTRLRSVLWHERRAMTPRQRFRAVYPKMYDPTYATACCVLAVVLASTFSLIFPLIGPAVVLLLFLTIVAHRFLVGYVYGRTDAQTGGLLQIWLLRRFATVVTFQPILLGLILMTRGLFPEGGALIGVAVVAMLCAEIYAIRKTRLLGRRYLSSVTQDALEKFEATANADRRGPDDEGTSLASSARARPRGSFASVLEMMSVTLAVMPTPQTSREAVPLETEALDDLTATERAARTHPDAPPHLPPLPFADHAEEMAGILYAPELIAPPPIIWLPNDSAGIARSEAYDLQRYHNLRTTLDVRSPDDVVPRRSSSSRSRTRV